MAQFDLNDTNKLGTYHIAANKYKDYETARSNYFNLIVDDLDDLIYPEFSYTGQNAANEYVTGKNPGRSGQEVLKLSVNKSFVPHFDSGLIEIKRGNSSVKFADTPTWQSSKTIEFQDFVGLQTKNVLMAWQALVYDVNSDTQGRAGDYTINGVTRRGYKRNATLVEYTPDHQIIRYWDIIGLWIKGLSESDFDVTNSNGGRQISATFEYDRAVMHQPDDFWE